ncbi:hypothetical protein HHK36_015008 [Tetracentron sinense]|uniref:Peptidase A1 domain-containing protein n=1 Tax=Tetracentron sinense TaxID=13715 RepID=A0A834Z6E1_TETSI|nr:hypothetical protein HHK36_015008 [Tetracentron sinense]
MEYPQLKGVVIITLPPHDNPSMGKTITAFTLSDNPPSPFQQPEQDHIPVRSFRSSPEPERRFSFRRFFFGSPRILLGFLGISILAIFLLNVVSSGTLLESRSSEDDREVNSFIFTLYPKLGSGETLERGVEFKLGRFSERSTVKTAAMINDGGKQRKINKLGSSVSAIDSSTIIPVRGNVYPDGLYYTSMLVGNPPRPYYLDMDTGSDLTWIQCDAPCTSCAKGPHPLYKPKGKIVPSKDSLCIEVQANQKSGHCESYQQCDYEIEYADRSSTMGVLARDELQLMIANGTLVKSSVVFGCAYDQQGQLLVSPAKTDGILGLSRAEVSLPSQLARQGIIHNVVGHCITNDAGGGGYMFLGDDFIPYWGMTWVPMLNSPSINFYHAGIVKLSYGGGQLSLGGLDNSVGRTVFDSGSSYTYFPKQAYSGLITSLKDVSAEGLMQDESDPTLPVCWRAKFPIRSVKDVKPFFKPLTLQFESRWWIVPTKLQIPPEGYLIISNKGNACLGILDGSKVHDGSTIILGELKPVPARPRGSKDICYVLFDISLRGQLVVYDNVNQKIGWAQSNCVKPRKFKSSHFF